MSEEENHGDVSFSISKLGIASIEFWHPMSNALPGIILQKLAVCIIELGENQNVKVIVLKSKGEKAFCAGASFDELIAIKDLEQGKKILFRICKCYKCLPKMP